MNQKPVQARECWEPGSGSLGYGSTTCGEAQSRPHLETCATKMHGRGEPIPSAGQFARLSHEMCGTWAVGLPASKGSQPAAGQWQLKLCVSFILIRSFLILSISYFSYSTCRSDWQLHCFNVELFIFYNQITSSKIGSPDMASVNVCTQGGS